MAGTGVERDAFGAIEVLADRLRGAQTPRSCVTEREFNQWVQSVVRK